MREIIGHIGRARQMEVAAIPKKCTTGSGAGVDTNNVVIDKTTSDTTKHIAMLIMPAFIVSRLIQPFELIATKHIARNKLGGVGAGLITVERFLRR